MRSSDTPETDPELYGPQGPADWSREPRSDDLFSDEAKERLRELVDEAQERRDRA